MGSTFQGLTTLTAKKFWRPVICVASSQAAQHRATKSLLLLNLSVHLIGQPCFYSTSCPLHLHMTCSPIYRMKNDEFEGERKLVKKIIILMRSLSTPFEAKPKACTTNTQIKRSKHGNIKEAVRRQTSQR